MIEVLFPIVTLGGLALFILWESWQRKESHAKPLTRARMDGGFEPGESNKRDVLVTLGTVGTLFGLYLFNDPPHPPFTGRGASLSGLIYVSLGPLGLPVLAGAISIVAFVGAYVAHRQSIFKKGKQHMPRNASRLRR